MTDVTAVYGLLGATEADAAVADLEAQDVRPDEIEDLIGRSIVPVPVQRQIIAAGVGGGAGDDGGGGLFGVVLNLRSPDDDCLAVTEGERSHDADIPVGSLWI